MKKRRSALLLTTIIIAAISIAFNIFAIIAFIVNLMGIRGLYGEILQKLYSATVDVDAEIKFVYFECLFQILIHSVFIYRFAFLYKKATPGLQLSKYMFSMSIWYLLLTCSIASIFAIIASLVMKNNSQRPIIAAAVPKAPEDEKSVTDFKMRNMTEAVNRLKELKQSGVITDEEYYASLDKILEG